MFLYSRKNFVYMYMLCECIDVRGDLALINRSEQLNPFFGAFLEVVSITFAFAGRSDQPEIVLPLFLNLLILLQSREQGGNVDFLENSLLLKINGCG